MNKFVFIALAALFVVVATQEISDLKVMPNKTGNLRFPNKTGSISVIGKPKNFTNPAKNLTIKPIAPRPVKPVAPVKKNETKFGDIRPYAPLANKTSVVPTRTPLPRPVKPNKTDRVRKNTSGIFVQDEEYSEESFYSEEDLEYFTTRKQNKTNTTRTHKNKSKNSTGGVASNTKKWFKERNQTEVEFEDVMEEIEDFVSGKKNGSSRNNKTAIHRPNRPNKSNRTNRTGRNNTNKTVKAGKGFFDQVMSWFFAEAPVEEEIFDDEDEAIEDFGMKKKNDTKKPNKPQPKNLTMKPRKNATTNTTTKPQKKNITNKTHPSKKNTTNTSKPEKKNTTNKTQPQKNTTKPTKPEKKNTTNKTQPQKKNTTNKTQPQKNTTKNQTKKISQ